MKARLEQIVDEALSVKKRFFQSHLDEIIAVAEAVIETFRNDGKIFLFGNGGSAADSQHIAAEYIGRFYKERQSLPAIALTTDTSILTALGNDYGYETVFARQLEGLARTGDLAFGISTSGGSPNVIRGVEKAKEIGVKTVSLTGGSGGDLAKLTDFSLIVPSKDTARIQEVHICIGHMICDLVETAMMES